MNMNEIVKHCLSYPHAFEDHPFGEGWTAIRHKENKKIFALIFLHNDHLCVNLKCDPDYAGTLRNTFVDVQPGYHMNKEHWNTVILDGDLLKEQIHDMVKHSFELTRPKVKKVRNKHV
ncbi:MULTISPECIES: MmcQ/YjbR family DNA-binding protein [Bacillus]|uniref:MmcQ/YjbR family DNA-binding protein n=1 Tax=Bacillus TaxID=1386 RepID=UPI00027ABDF2|nr:MmcQ/YjbR family DNA-binding protein [Bacillus wiedmannii]EJS65315.1 hypothetical protein ICW_03966 [Bacillus wiedmannii]OFD11310.1 hypothetical protein BTGOE6_11070 [Bacillus wiedmannii]PEU20008.1 hypothetical protein CN532_30830 [Bacillus wiedmannii]PGB40880.1 hypothetical protein COM01_20580 [Bacillus wiedmannii]PGD58159.1 hypothetical protein COM40_09990 [Bacillus wiedmannii]